MAHREAWAFVTV